MSHQTVKNENSNTEYLGHDATYYRNLARWGRGRRMVGLRVMQESDLKLISDIGNRLALGQPLSNKIKRRKERVINIVEEAKKLGFPEDIDKVIASAKSGSSGIPKEIHKTIKNQPSEDVDQDLPSPSRYDYREIFEKSIQSPFPEEWTPASPYLREAHRLEIEGEDQRKVDEMIEKARRADSIATSYYLGRWEIIKKNRPKYVKLDPEEKP
jgi:hypothetical protein